ncbi:MAG: efflux RND transporter permease subunit, partial [Candidatus Omnitrophota bacterium]
MNFPEFGVKRPVTNLMIFLGIIVVALYSLSKLGIDNMPEIEPPVISVIATYPGASPEDVEAKVIEPLENQLGSTPGLDKITARCLEGLGVISLKFNWGTNLDEASNDIRDRIDLAKRFLPDIPDEMENPIIFKFNSAMMPIIFMSATATDSYPNLYDIIDKKIIDQLKQVSGVGTIQIYGGLERQINIWIDRDKLQGYGFSVLEVKNVLAKENITQPAGSIKSGLTDYLVRIPGEFANPQEIETVILGTREGKLIYLKDVARIEDSHKEVKSIVRNDRKLGLVFFVQKQTGTNTVQVADRVKKKLESLKKTLPSDVEVDVAIDNSEDIITTLKTLGSTVWMGIILVIFVIWFFLRQFKPSFIIAFTIPFSLMMALIYLFMAGKTINVISLSSIVIALGMVVDAAIVVVDNIFSRLERKERPKEAAIFGTTEVFAAIAASTLTTVVVFAPLMFVKGVVGIIFGELAAVVIITLLGSLFTATTFTPMLCSRWLSVKNIEGSQRNVFVKKIYDFLEKAFKRLEEFYSRLLERCLRHKKTVIIGFAAMFAGSLFLMPFVGNEFSPDEDTGDISVNISLPIGTRIEETDRVASELEEIYQ